MGPIGICPGCGEAYPSDDVINAGAARATLRYTGGTPARRPYLNFVKIIEIIE